MEANRHCLQRTGLVLCAAALLFVPVTFLAFGGYPTLNDIAAVLSISSIEGDGRWTNGFYGPGYTMLSLVIGPNMYRFGVTFIAIFCLSIGLGAANILQSSRPSGIALALFSFSSAFLFLAIGLNYTDGIFVALIHLGLQTLYRYFFLSRRVWLLMGGALCFSFSILLRHHGLVFVLLVLPLIWNLDSIFSAHRRGPVLHFYIATLAPAGLVFAALHYTGAGGNWQAFNLYKFLYDVNWRETAELVESGSIDLANFPWNDILHATLTALKQQAFKIVALLLVLAYPLIAINPIASRIGYAARLGGCAAYLVLVLPSFDRGILPLLAVLIFVSLYVWQTKITRVPIAALAITTLIIATAGVRAVPRLVEVYQKEIPATRAVINEISERGIEMHRVVTDDFNLFVPNSAPGRLQPIGGWTQLHPDLRRSVKDFIEVGAGRDFFVVVAVKDGYLQNHPRYASFLGNNSAELVELSEHTLYFFDEHGR